MWRMALAAVLLSACAWAQNPVSDALRDDLPRWQKNTIGAADEMPADKYGYKPTDAQVPFGHWVSHATAANNIICARLTGATAPDAGVKETDPKDKLIDALKKSFDYCTAQLPKLQDSQMGEEIEWFGGRKITKGAATLALSADWADHYSQMSSYLRMNGLLPPTAKKK
jgi:DinB superfamily